jgi:hypothetical protein
MRRSGGQPPVQRANDTRGEGLIEAVWVSDGEGLLSNLKIGRPADRDGPEGRSGILKLKHCEIVSRRHTNHTRIRKFTRGQPCSNSLGSADDVIIGDHIAGGVPHNSCARLNVILLIFVEHRILPPAAGKHMQNWWRGCLKELDSSLLGLAQIAPRSDSPWSGRGGP